jgi:hypothetical protein
MIDNQGMVNRLGDGRAGGVKNLVQVQGVMRCTYVNCSHPFRLTQAKIARIDSQVRSIRRRCPIKFDRQRGTRSEVLARRVAGGLAPSTVSTTPHPVA